MAHESNLQDDRMQRRRLCCIRGYRYGNLLVWGYLLAVVPLLASSLRQHDVCQQIAES